MPRCLIGLGSNLGDRLATLEQAVVLLRQDTRLHDLRVSRWHETSPVGGPIRQQLFLNGVAAFDADLSPPQLLARLHEIEDRLGRKRHLRWGPRTIDLDLLIHGEAISDDPLLTLPHPRMAFRRFVLRTAAEVAADLREPHVGWTVGELLANLNRRPVYVAITGLPGTGKTRLAEAAAASGAGRLLRDPAAGLIDAARSDSSGPYLTSEVEFLVRRAEALRASAFKEDSLIVSDFSLWQSLPYARARLTEPGHFSLVERMHELSRQVLRPQLTIVLDVGPRELQCWRPDGGLRGWSPEEIARFLPAMHNGLTGPGVGPVLHVPAAAGGSALIELQAAIEAMQ